MSRLVPLVVALLLAAGAVLVASVRSLDADRDRLMDGFADEQMEQAREAAIELQNRLEGLDDDARLLKDLITRTRSSSKLPPEVQDQTTLSSFEALATVVRAYRSIVLLVDGLPVVTALDPSEVASTRDAFLASSLHALQTAERTSARLVGPFPVGQEKTFYFHVTSLGPLGSIVIALEPRRFLAGVLRSRADARQVVEDPAGLYWVGCAQPSTCRLAGTELEKEPLLEAAARFMAAPSGTEWLTRDVGETIGLSRGPAVATWTETDAPKGIGWRVLIVTSAAPLRSAMTSAARRLVGAVAALVGVMVGIGTVIVWQQRRAGALQERIRHIERVQSLEDQLVRAEKLATTGVLAAGIAHEIGTPLGIIRGRAELLLAEPEGAGLQRGLGGIIEQIDRIADTIGQVLDFSRAQPVSLQPVQPQEVVRSTLDLLEHRFRRHRIAVETSIDPDLPPVAADPAQLQQVLVNILINASDACDPGAEVAIAVNRDGDPGLLRWTIRDSGSGIDPGHLRAVFDPFFTTKKRGEGTGLGLTVAANIVRNHGAQISLTSAVGQGTTVTLRWPTSGGAHA